jgi:hypothetical protein
MSNESEDTVATKLDINTLKFSKPFSNIEKMGKEPCPKCSKSRSWFCYECMIPMGDPTLIPNVKLPSKVIIIQHPRELKSKSTAVHAKVLSPDFVEVYQYPSIPDFLSYDNCVILYPSKEALSMEELVHPEDKNIQPKDVWDNVQYFGNHILFIVSFYRRYVATVKSNCA